MLDNFLNSAVLTLIVAIGAVVATSALQPAHPGANTRLVATPARVVQLPTVVVVGHRERAPVPTTVAVAN